MNAVTRQMNGSTGRSGINHSSKTHCPAGHAYAEHGFVFPGRPTARNCDICRPETVRKAQARRTIKLRAGRPPRPPARLRPAFGVRVLNAAYREHEYRERLAAPSVEITWSERES